MLTYREKICKGKEEMGEEKKGNRKREGGKLTMAFQFSKPLKFVLGLPKWEFSNGKKHFIPGNKIRKTDFAPSEKYSSYASV